MFGNVPSGSIPSGPSGLIRAVGGEYKLAMVRTGVSNEDGFQKIRLDPVTVVSARWNSVIRNLSTAAGDQSCVAARPRAIPSDF